jgi:putative serine protease PepD
VIKKNFGGHSQLGTGLVAVMALVISVVTLSLVYVRHSQDPVATPIAAGANQSQSGFFQWPTDMEKLITQTAPSVATIFCADSQGSGWVLDERNRGTPLPGATDVTETEFPTNIITNHHVIESCLKDPEKIRVIAGGKRQQARLFNLDKRNDLALIVVADRLPPLQLAGKPQPGWWAMTYGTPFGVPGSVTIGNIVTMEKSWIVSTSPVNPGNSGGPLLNAEGHVMGTVTSSEKPSTSQNWNFSSSLPMLCRKILNCGSNDFGWAKKQSQS